MKISQKAKVIEPSLSRQLFNLAKQYSNVIDLTLGDPDFPPSPVIRDAACAAIHAGKTRYSANAGLLELRQAIAACMADEYGIAPDPGKNIIITVGGMEALYLSLACLLDEGDEVIIPAPYYVNYVQMVRVCGGVPVIIETSEEAGFVFTAEQLEAAVTERTVAIILNSPCNPTGMMLGAALLDEVAEIARKHDLVVISDEVYRSLIYDGNVHESMITRPGMQERTVLVDSLSKRFAMTGYRIGYAIAPEELTANMVKMQENVAACAPLPSQHAGIAAYRLCHQDTHIAQKFLERRDYIYQAINEIDGLRCIKPAGTFYLFVNIAATGLDCLTFAYRLLEDEQVAVVPGITYGTAYSDYIRIAFTLELNDLKEAANRLARFLSSLRTEKKEVGLQ